MSTLLFIFLAEAQLSFAHETDPNTTLRKATEYLWSQQADDGAWHSEQYAVLRSGQALTPYVLHTLLHVPESIYPRPTDKAKRGLKFIRDHVDSYGHLGHADPDVIEYPVYSTAYAIRCLLEAHKSFTFEAFVKRDGVTELIRSWEQKGGILVSQMRRFLLEAQLTEQHGFTMDSPSYGGWGFDKPQKPGVPGHMDLAHTRRALEALNSVHTRWLTDPRAIAGHKITVARAEQFLKVVQKHPDARKRQPFIEGFSPATADPPFDGGFYFSPVVLAANKGREEFKDAKYFRSYATATCDGVLALLAAGVPRDDERLVRAVEWLKSHDDLAYPEGIPTEHPEPWGEAVRFYHYAVRAEAYAALDWPGDWRARLAAEVICHQNADGSFRNTKSPLMKEDDPLLCTTLAVIALTHCGKTGGEYAPAR